MRSSGASASLQGAARARQRLARATGSGLPRAPQEGVELIFSQLALRGARMHEEMFEFELAIDFRRATPAKIRK
jgi:hypothetical protein